MIRNVKNMKRNVHTFTLLVTLILSVTLYGAAPSGKDPLKPDEIHPLIGRTISQLLPKFHYNHQNVDNALSSEILDLYLDRLDPARLYFLASDVAEFDKFRYELDDEIQTGNLNAAFIVFNTFIQRAEQRIDFALNRIKREFDFSIDESYQTDREDAEWVKDVADLNKLWDKKLKNEALNLKLAGQNWGDIQKKLAKRYTNFQRRVEQYNSEDVFRYFVNRVSETFDPHTSYFSPRTAENFGIDMSLKYKGIGAQLTTEDEFTKVVRILPGGPAERSQELAPNDKIIGVAQGYDGELVDVVGMRLDDVVQKIRGPKGTVIRLQIIPAGTTDHSKTKEISLVRDEIILEERAAKAETVELTHNGKSFKLGVINIPSFYADLNAQRRGEVGYKRTTTDVRRLIDELTADGVEGILIDLRGNGGGSLQEAIELTGLFIDQGPVVQVKESKGFLGIKNDPDPELVYDGPLAILVDRLSASASEIFAGAIQDYGRGLVLGNRTYGKGTVQSLYSLDRLPNLRNQRVGQLKVTIAKFYRITGSSTQHRGVIPDINFPTIFDEYDYGESKQLHALPWDEIAPAHFKLHDKVSKYLSTLTLSSQKRTEQNPEFQYLKEDIERFRMQKNHKLISLQEAKRRAERKEAEARRLARINERRKAKGKNLLKEGEDIPKEDNAPDAILNESEHILADLIEMSAPDGADRVAKTNQAKDKNKKKNSGTVKINN
ncbi:MAG: carboxy terminal-processing peptidase [bacterium]